MVVVAQLGIILYTCTNTCTSAASPPLPLASLCPWDYNRLIIVWYITHFIQLYVRLDYISTVHPSVALARKP